MDTSWQYECCYWPVLGAHRRGMRPHLRMYGVDAASSVLSSDIESVSVIDSEDTCSRSVSYELLSLINGKIT